MVTIAADLLRTEEVPSYSYLLDMWLVEHTGLTLPAIGRGMRASI